MILGNLIADFIAPLLTVSLPLLAIINATGPIAG